MTTELDVIGDLSQESSIPTKVSIDLYQSQFREAGRLVSGCKKLRMRITLGSATRPHF